MVQRVYSFYIRSKPSKSFENGGRVAFSSIQPFPPARKPGHKPSAKQSAPTNSDKEPGSAPKQGVRGKRSKMKRAQQKYRHQDEQERQIKMAVLQVYRVKQVLSKLPGLHTSPNQGACVLCGMLFSVGG